MNGLRLPLVLLGPTASGKSDVAMAYAAASSDREIVAVDAMQVYRGMDIGTAKPSAHDRSVVAHHCLDLIGPSDDGSVVEFAAAANDALEGIVHRGHRPVLVGGTGLYLRSITDPMEVPGQWPQVKAQLLARADAEGTPTLHRQLATLDPVAATRIDPQNTRRVVRALEVTLGSGRPFSSFGPGLDQYPRVPFVQIGLQWPRPVLAARIEQRVHGMMHAGLAAEVEGLWRGPTPLSRTARQALGYKELIDHLEGRCSLAEAVDTIIVRTRQFAVRQERWFRRDPRVRWVHLEHDPVAEVLPLLPSP
ncbi:MAG: tRNA (adenosine(37)-N6)-dimethylallyltransferase MiaA [Actinomycetota bacterium]